MKFRLNDFNLQFDSQETEEFHFNLNFILACDIHTVHVHIYLIFLMTCLPFCAMFIQCYMLFGIDLR